MGQVISFKDYKAEHGKSSASLGDGVRMDLLDGAPSIVLSVPNVRQNEIAAFNKGVSQFQLLVVSHRAPVILWSFAFAEPINLIEVNFDQKLANPAELHKTFERDQYDFNFFLASDGVCVSSGRLRVESMCWAAWLVALKRQKEAAYTKEDFTADLIKIYDFSQPDELIGKGTLFTGKWHKTKAGDHRRL